MRQPSILAVAAIGIAIAAALPLLADEPKAAPPKGAGLSASEGAAVQPLGSFDHVPVGIAISKDDRVFLAFSRAIDEKQPFSVAERKDGKAEPFPPGFQQEDGAPAEDRLIAVQAITVDAKGRLWILDCAKVGTQPVKDGGPKLIGYDLEKKKVWKTIPFPKAVAGPTSFLNDIRIDLQRGKEGVAFITDASPEGPNGIVVVDLADARAVRRLNDHASTKADPSVTLDAEGVKLIQKQGKDAGKPFQVGADGIALSSDRRWLYYCPLTSRKLFRADAEALADLAKDDAAVTKTVEDLGDKGFAADGLLEDAQGRILLTDFENGKIHRRSADGKMEVLATAKGWPDTLALKADGTLVFTLTQIHLSPRFHDADRREKPFRLGQVKTDSAAVWTGPGGGRH